MSKIGLILIIFVTSLLAGCSEPPSGGGGGRPHMGQFPRQGGSWGGGWHDADWWTGNRVVLTVIALLIVSIFVKLTAKTIKN